MNTPHTNVCRATGTSTHLSSGVVDESFGALRVDPAIPALNRRFRRFRRCSSGPGVPALFWQSRRFRRYDGCPGVSGAQLTVPTIQMPRAFRPVQSLIRVPSDKAIKKRPSFFSQSKRNDESAKNEEFFGLYRRIVSKTINFGEQCEMKTQRTKMNS